LRILCVCGMGLGSSLLLKMQVESVLKELNTKADSIEIADIGSARGMATDLVVTSPQFAEMLKGMDAPVVTINNYMDKKEIRQKVGAALGIAG
jgi:PTS system ascorbate-specific IIB component